jgi:hypothetical protein
VRHRRGCGAECAGLPGELADEGEGGACLLDPDGESRQDISAWLPGGAESAAEAGEGVRGAGVEGEPGGAGDDAEGAEVGRVRAGEQQVSAISSQAAMNVAMLPAAGTSSRLVMNSGSSAVPVRPPAAVGGIADAVADGRRTDASGRDDEDGAQRGRGTA